MLRWRQALNRFVVRHLGWHVWRRVQIVLKPPPETGQSLDRGAGDSAVAVAAFAHERGVRLARNGAIAERGSREPLDLLD